MWGFLLAYTFECFSGALPPSQRIFNLVHRMEHYTTENKDEAMFVLHLLHKVRIRETDLKLELEALLISPLPNEARNILPFDFLFWHS